VRYEATPPVTEVPGAPVAIDEMSSGNTLTNLKDQKESVEKRLLNLFVKQQDQGKYRIQFSMT
jgi:hypothetical protein